MKRLIYALFLAGVTTPAFAGDVGVTIRIGEPGFSGEINIGNYPRPQLYYAQPVIIERAPDYDEAPPLYLVVPPGHERHWERHCAEYRACGRRVYFVRRDWYQREYIPRYQRERDGREGGGEEYRGDDRGERDHDHDHGKGHDDDHGHGNRHGRGHDGDQDRRDHDDHG